MLVRVHCCCRHRRDDDGDRVLLLPLRRAVPSRRWQSWLRRRLRLDHTNSAMDNQSHVIAVGALLPEDVALGEQILPKLNRHGLLVVLDQYVLAHGEVLEVDEIDLTTDDC